MSAKDSGLRGATEKIMRQTTAISERTPVKLGFIISVVVAVGAWFNSTSNRMTEMSLTNQQALEVLKEVKQELSAMRAETRETRERLIVLETKIGRIP